MKLSLPRSEAPLDVRFPGGVPFPGRSCPAATLCARHRRRGRLPRLLGAAILAFAAALPAARDARAAGEEGAAGPDSASAFDAQHLLSLAEQGDARAAFLLGARFASGQGGARDDSEAYRWFRKAAERGLAEAQYNLGVMYASGRGVTRNMIEAARWYEAAANQGIAEAQFNIGTLYGMGRGVPKDEVRAAKWLEKAASKSLPRAQFNLGILYEHGRGVRQDARSAMRWYRKAAEQGFAPAGARLAALERKLSPGESPEVSSEPPPPVSVSVPAGLEPDGGSFVDGLDPQQFTIQLLSDTDESNVRRFVDRHVEPDRGGYFSSEIDGRRWYSVVYGAYESREAAKTASAGLPPELRRLKPWIRRAEAIHQQMNR